MGRTPSSAPDPLVRLFLHPTKPTRGSAAGQGARPTNTSRNRRGARGSGWIVGHPNNSELIILHWVGEWVSGELVQCPPDKLKQFGVPHMNVAPDRDLGRAI